LSFYEMVRLKADPGSVRLKAETTDETDETYET